MPNILKRTIFGAIFVAITCFMVLFNEYTCAFYLALCCAIMTYEFMKIHNVQSYFIRNMVGLIAWMANLAAFWYFYGTNMGFIILAITLLVLFIIQLFRHEKPENSLGISSLALIYIALPLSIAIYISQINTQLIMAIFILIWISDTMAYLVGCKFGKHRLFERISPKKSWEGAIGGFVFTVAIGAFGGYLFPSLGFKMWQWCVIAVVVDIFGVLGDLIESMFKRSVGVKDSGNIIPGHGGLLDRLDSFIFAVPWVAITVWAMERFA